MLEPPEADEEPPCAGEPPPAEGPLPAEDPPPAEEPLPAEEPVPDEEPEPVPPEPPEGAGEPLDPDGPDEVEARGPPYAAGGCPWLLEGSLPAPDAVSPHAARARQSAAAAGQRSQAALALRVMLIRLG